MKKRFLNSEVIFGVVAIFVAVFFIVSGWKLPGETANGVPGSGYFPAIVAGGVIIFPCCSSFRGSEIQRPTSV